MIRTIIIIGFLLSAVAFNSNAQDSDRIGPLEKEIQEIKLRLSRLESLHSNPSKAQDLESSVEGWKSVTNWRKLSTDMGTSDVRKILGEPHRLDGGNIAYWYYQNGGRVIFLGEKVYEWREPRK